LQLTADYPGFFMHRRMICENDSFARNRGRLLRAKLRNRRFVRNRGLLFTGKSQKSTFCPYPGSYFYGQISEIDVLPVSGVLLLRANHRNRCFARNRGLLFTGKSQKSTFCPYPGSYFYGQITEIAFLPVTEGCLLRANPRNRRFARNRRPPFTGKSQKSTFCP